MPIIFIGAIMMPMAQWYYVLCAVFVVGGLFSLFFAGENFARHTGGITTWVLSGVLLVVGVTLLYIGFSSFLEFSYGHHSTIDSLLDNVENVGRFFRT